MDPFAWDVVKRLCSVLPVCVMAVMFVFVFAMFGAIASALRFVNVVQSSSAY